jgi:Na+-transporting methylmalonyl-CoA/oxaloacetate decarboxylase gamma subunit
LISFNAELIFHFSESKYLYVSFVFFVLVFLSVLVSMVASFGADISKSSPDEYICKYSACDLNQSDSALSRSVQAFMACTDALIYGNSSYIFFHGQEVTQASLCHAIV